MPKVSLVMEFDSEDEARAYLQGNGRSHADPQPEPEREPEPTPVSDNRADDADAGVDVDGMPYDPAVHSNPPSTTQDGRWRAARGKAEEAKAARAAFLASGGNETPPDDLPSMGPETEADRGLPEMPELPEPMPTPVTIEELYGAIYNVLENGRSKELLALYSKHCGSTDRHAIDAALRNDESKRAALMADLDSLR